MSETPVIEINGVKLEVNLGSAKRIDQFQMGGGRMTFLVFDTETTGVIQKSLPVDHPSQPHVVQLGMELCDGEKTVSAASIVVDPGVEVPEESAKIHGMTTEVVRKFGVPKVVAVALFNNFARLAQSLVAHNAAFDIGVLAGEYMRLKRDPPFGSKQVYCTMALSTEVCKIPGKYRDYKWPSLQEAYRELVDPGGFDGAHDAMADVRACRAVFQKLAEMGVVR